MNRPRRFRTLPTLVLLALALAAGFVWDLRRVREARPVAATRPASRNAPATATAPTTERALAVLRLPAIAGPQPYPTLSAHYVISTDITDARAFTFAGPKEVHRYEVAIGKRNLILMVERQPAGTFGWFVSGTRDASNGVPLPADEAIKRLEGN